MLIDTHCHLNFKSFATDYSIIVRRSQKSGVERIIIPGTDLTSSNAAISIAQQFPSCFAAIGIHPHHAKNTNLYVGALLQNKLTTLLTKNKVAAIGEVGMDYFQYRKTKYKNTKITDTLKKKQRELFELQLKLAHTHNLPVIIHCREAFPDLFTILEAFIEKSAWQPHGVFHCFGGSKKHLRQALAMGFYVGFDGNITYDQNLPAIVKEAPLQRIVIETDAPFLTPIPHRNTRNEPQYVAIVAQKIADIHGLPLATVAAQTTQNAYTLFPVLNG